MINKANLMHIQACTQCSEINGLLVRLAINIHPINACIKQCKPIKFYPVT